jgi:2-polyprenyl-3-methyl-5-hydroxy-6-metoxy-1,4-benzoquinol methylase
VLRTDEALEYWDRRHEREGWLRSGGDIGLSAELNEMFYVIRLAKLISLIGPRTSPSVPLFTLDGGCGKGYFSEALQRCGHRVTGIDASAHAIEHCRRTGNARYEQSSLHSFSSPWLYDVVYAVDVLFHILDDDVWKRSLVNLASLVRLSGLLIVTDVPGDSVETKGNYIVHRPRAAYLDTLSSLGFRLRSVVPYQFLGNDIGFYCFVRAA